MYKLVLFIGTLAVCDCQVLQLGLCSKVDPVVNFNLDKFLGRWYEIERFPIWYEYQAHCAYKEVVRLGEDLEIQHHYVIGDIEYVLHVNATVKESSGVFEIAASHIDTIGIPLTVVATDYTNYAVVYGCRHQEQHNIKFVTSWILSRQKDLNVSVLSKAYRAVNSLPQVTTAYMEGVSHREEQCSHFWTAHVYD